MNRKSTIVRSIATSLKALELVAPAVAARWASRLFFTPGRRRPSAAERALLGQAERFWLAVGSRKVAGFSWGTGRPVLLVHGWGGYSAQFAELVPALLARGHRVVAVDFPAHGMSSGVRSNVFEFRAALLELGRREGAFRAVIAHSLGAMAASLALRAELRADVAVLIAPMTSFTFAVNTFSRELGMSHPLQSRATARIVDQFDADDAELELVRGVSEMRLPLLVVHDQDDRRVPTQLGRDLVAAWPGARYVETRELGHKRILSAPEVLQQIADFVASPAALRLPASGRPLRAVTAPALVSFAS